MPQKTILLMAGGTGGHVFPALAIAESLKKQGIYVCWLGTQKGLEARVVPNANIDIHYISITGLRGKGLFSLFLAPFKILRAIWQAINILKSVRPNAVVGMGGFVTGPGGIAARILRIPVLIHEQNAIAGLTNRWLARIATQVMTAFPNTFPEKYHPIYTGNPLRADILALGEKRVFTSETLHILIFGGSLGAQALNETVPSALLKIGKNIEVWHQVGESHIEIMQNAYETATFPTKIVAFIEDMATAYAWADLVICRSGALTISELAQAGIPSILVPYPHAVDDHQTQNAKFLSEQEGAILLPQTQLTSDKLADLIQQLMSNPQRLQKMADATKHCAKPDAVTQVMTLIMQHTHSL